MSDVFNKHRLSDGRAVWLQRVKLPGVRKPQWSMVISGLEWCEAPQITPLENYQVGLTALAEVLKADVMEECL